MEPDNENEEIVELNIETELSKEKRLECRQIVQEIRNFRVSQRQILFLVELLALELENRDAMLAIVKAVKANRSKMDTSILQLPNGDELV